MEDAHVTLDALPPPVAFDAWERCSFYAVYDGHGGAEASDYCRVHLHRNFLSHLAELLAADTDSEDEPPSPEQQEPPSPPGLSPRSGDESTERGGR